MSAESPQAPLSRVLHCLPSKLISLGLNYKELSLQFLDALNQLALNVLKQPHCTTPSPSSDPSSLWQRGPFSLRLPATSATSQKIVNLRVPWAKWVFPNQ